LKNVAIDFDENGQGEPIIFLHGIGGGAASFQVQLENLNHYHCIAWNMPGYGSSKKNNWPPTFESLSIALSDFISSLGLQKVHLVGQSIGGMLAIDHALRHRHQVASLVLIATTSKFGGRDETFKEQFLKARLAPLEAGQSMQQLAKNAAPMLVGPAAEDKVISEIEAILAAVSESTWRGILECLITFDKKAELPAIDLPCCLIAGSHDKNAPAKTMQKMSEAIAGCEFHLIDGAGHMVNQEAADLTNNIINTFLRQHPL